MNKNDGWKYLAMVVAASAGGMLIGLVLGKLFVWFLS